MTLNILKLSKLNYFILSISASSCMGLNYSIYYLVVLFT
jgi:hypothetical protein